MHLISPAVCNVLLRFMRSRMIINFTRELRNCSGNGVNSEAQLVFARQTQRLSLVSSFVSRVGGIDNMKKRNSQPSQLSREALDRKKLNQTSQGAAEQIENNFVRASPVGKANAETRASLLMLFRLVAT
jgi:hypothetical protein